MDADVSVYVEETQQSWFNYISKLEKKLEERRRYTSADAEEFGMDCGLDDIVTKYDDNCDVFNLKVIELKLKNGPFKKEDINVKLSSKGGTVKFITHNKTGDISNKGSTSKYEIDLCFSVPSKDFVLFNDFKPKSYFEEPESLERLEKLKETTAQSLSRDDFYFLYEYIFSILESKIIELLYNRDRSFVINNTAYFKKWHNKSNVECNRLKQYLPKNLIRLFVAYLLSIMYQQPTSMCQKEVELRLFWLYHNCDDHSSKDVNDKLCKEIKILCRNHDENSVVAAAKNLRMSIMKNDCFGTVNY